MKVRRDISSIPYRTAKETWHEICELITGQDSIDKNQLNSSQNILESLITDELFSETPLTLTGVGHRLVIYLKYGQESIEFGGDVDTISWNPTSGDWKMFIPVNSENIEWISDSLSKIAPRIIPHLPGDTPKEDSGNQNSAKNFQIDWRALQ